MGREEPGKAAPALAGEGKFLLEMGGRLEAGHTGSPYLADGPHPSDQCAENPQPSQS